MTDRSIHVKWKDLADELVRQDSRLLGRGYTIFCQLFNSDNYLNLHHVSKNCAFLFLSELRQISTNFNKFW